MNRDAAINFFRELIQKKFNVNPDDARVKEQLQNFAKYKTESEESNKKRIEAIGQFKIQFAPATFKLEQTMVEKSKFPNLNLNWSENTIDFISKLAETSRKCDQEKKEAESRVKLLEDQLTKKYDANADSQSKQIMELSEKLRKMQKQEDILTEANRSLTMQNNEISAQIVATSKNVESSMSSCAQLKEDNKKLNLQNKDNINIIQDWVVRYEELQNEIEKCNSDLRKLSLINSELTTQVGSQRKENIDNAISKKELTDQKRELEKKDKEIGEHKRAIEDMRKNIQKMRDESENQYKIEKTRMQILFAAQKSLMEKQLQHNIEEFGKNSSSSNSILALKIQTLQTELANEKEAHNREKESCEEEKSELTKSTESCFDTIKENNAKIRDVEYEIQRLQRELNAQTSNSKDCETSKMELEKKIEELENEQNKLERQNNNLNFQVNGVKHTESERNLYMGKQSSNLKTQLENAIKQIEELEIEQNNLKSQNAQLNFEVNKFKHTESERELHLMKDSSNLKTQLKNATKQIEDFKAQNKDITVLVSQQENEIADARKKDEQKQAMDACLIENSFDSLKWTDWKSAKVYFLGRYGNVQAIEGLQGMPRLQTQIDEMAQNETLDEVLESFISLSQIFINSSSSYSVEPNCMQNLVDITIKFLQSQNAIVSKRKEMSELRYENIKDKEVAEQKLKDQKEEYYKIKDEFFAIEKMIEETKQNLSKHNEDLSKHNEDLSKQNEDLSYKNDDLSKQNDDLSYKNDDLSYKNDDLSSQNQDLSSQNQDLSSQNQDLSSQNRGLSEEKQDLNDYTVKLQEKIIELQEKMENLQKQMIQENDKLDINEKEKMIKLLNANEEANESIEQLLGKLEIIKEELYRKDTEIDMLVERNNLLKERKQQLEKQLDDHVANVERLMSEKDKLIADLEKSHSINSQQNDENQGLKQYIINENAKMLENLTNAANMNRELFAELENTKQEYDISIEEKKQRLREMERVIEEFELKIGTLNAIQQRELVDKNAQLAAQQAQLRETEEELQKIIAQMRTMEQMRAQIEQEFEIMRNTNQTQQKEHADEIYRAQQEYDKSKALSDKQLAESKALCDQQLEQLRQELERLRQQSAQKDQDTAKDDLINKLQQKLSAIYKQQIIEKANYTLNRMNYVPPKYVAPTTISLNKSNRVGKDLIKLFGGSGLTMKGGTIINFSYDDEDDPSLQIDINNIKFLTNDEITDIANKITGLKDEIAALKSNPVTSSPNLKLLIKKLLLIKAAHSQNIKSMLFEKIANEINKQIITTQLPAIEQLKKEYQDLETKHAATVSSGSTGTSGSSGTTGTSGTSGTSGSTGSTAKLNLNSGMFKDKNVIYYKMPATA